MNAVVQQFPGETVTLLVVWERVLLSDTHPPSNRDLARAADRRVAQFWDKDRWVSRALKPAIVALGQDSQRHRYRQKGDVLWDTVAVYPPGVRWDQNAPVPAYTGGPVVNVSLDLRQALQQALNRGELKPGVGK